MLRRVTTRFVVPSTKNNKATSTLPWLKNHRFYSAEASTSCPAAVAADPSLEVTAESGPLSHIRVGNYATMTKVFTQEHVRQFAELVGDFNPAHFDEEYVKREMKGIFKGKVVHGILMGGMISTLAGTVLPGPGSIYLSQTFQFVKPGYMDQPLVARVECKKALNKSGNVFLFDTTVTNQETGEVLIKGEATVYHQKLKILQEDAPQQS